MSHSPKVRLQRLRWTAFGVVGLAYILSFFHRFAPAAIAGDLQQAFDTSAAALGGLAATYFYVYTLMQIPTGVLADTLGPRRIVTAGGVVAGVGSILFGLADSFWLASAGRVLVGLGVSVTFISLLKLNAAWFNERVFGALSGLTILMGNMGAVLAASPLAWALGYLSWREVFVGVGGCSLVLAALSFHLVRDHPAEAGLPSPRELDGKAAHAPHAGHWLEGLREVLGNRWTWPGLFVNLGLSGSFFAFGGLWAMPLLTRSWGLEQADAAFHATLLLVGFAIGAFLIGLISDRLGSRKPVMITASLFYLGGWLALTFAGPIAAPWGYLLFLCMGLGASAFVLTWACAKEVNRHALSGMATAVVNVGGFLGAAILQPLAGWALDRAAAVHGGPPLPGDYPAGMAVMAGFAALGMVAIFFVRETHCRNLTR
jgi:sugar phosphate permease